MTQIQIVTYLNLKNGQMIANHQTRNIFEPLTVVVPTRPDSMLKTYLFKHISLKIKCLNFLHNSHFPGFFVAGKLSVICTVLSF